MRVHIHPFPRITVCDGSVCGHMCKVLNLYKHVSTIQSCRAEHLTYALPSRNLITHIHLHTMVRLLWSGVTRAFGKTSISLLLYIYIKKKKPSGCRQFGTNTSHVRWRRVLKIEIHFCPMKRHFNGNSTISSTENFLRVTSHKQFFLKFDVKITTNHVFFFF